jgi:DNA polymerase-3 subunit beta
MEFTIDRETFLEGIQKTLGIVEKQTATPILQNLLIKTMDGNAGIEILASNREIGIRTNYDASVIKPGELTIPAKKLNEIVRELQGESIHLVTKGKNAAVLTSNKAICKINGLEASDFPEIINPDGLESLSISPALLCDMLHKAFYAVSKDESRRHMAGIFFQKTGDDDKISIRMAATDGHRLAIARADRSESDIPIPEKGVIIPRKGAAEIRKISEGIEDDVRIGFAQGACIVEAGRATLRVNLIDSAYPDIQRVIPDETAEGILRIIVVRDALLHSLRRMAVYGDSCALDIHSGAIHLQAQDPDIGEIKDEIEIETPAADEKRIIKFNVRYLIDAIDAVSDEKVVLNIPSGFGGCLIRGSEDINYLAVVMPLRG